MLGQVVSPQREIRLCPCRIWPREPVVTIQQCRAAYQKEAVSVGKHRSRAPKSDPGLGRHHADQNLEGE